MNRESQPSVIGPYRIVKTLGRGLMGPVYLGVQQNQYWALRVINQDLMQITNSVNHLVGDVLHETLVRYKEIGTDDKIGMYIVTDYVESKKISRQSMQGLRSIQRLNILIKLLEGISLLHQRGAVHGLIKTTNILVRSRSTSYQTLTIDAGFIYTVNERIATHFLTSAFYSMSPELINAYLSYSRPMIDAALTIKTDIYSAGLLVSEVLSGMNFFSEVRNKKDLIELKERSSIGIGGVNDPFGEIDLNRLDVAVRSATAPDRELRFEFIDEFISAIKDSIKIK